MKTIAHVSDLHFGREDPRLTAALLAELDGTACEAPTLVAVSGDLTQRARAREFVACRAFLDKLPAPYVVVPGNHDVPLYNVFRRLFHPLHAYCAHITRELVPTFSDGELAVVGIDTAYGLTLKDGRVNDAQTRAACDKVQHLEGRWRVLVAHHPFVVPSPRFESDRVHGAAKALPALVNAGFHVILSGHLHVAHSPDVTTFASEQNALLSIHAGTAISTRLRGERNGYNKLTFDDEVVTVVQRIWNGTAFVDHTTRVYARRPRAKA